VTTDHPHPQYPGRFAKNLAAPSHPLECDNVVGGSHDVFSLGMVGEIMCSKEGFNSANYLAHGDIRVSDPKNPEFVVVRIKTSKTDPFWKGVSVYLGRTGQGLCPVAAMLSYMVQQGAKEGQFFLFDDRRELTYEWLMVETHSSKLSAGGRAQHMYVHAIYLST